MKEIILGLKEIGILVGLDQIRIGFAGEVVEGEVIIGFAAVTTDPVETVTQGSRDGSHRLASKLPTQSGAVTMPLASVRNSSGKRRDDSSVYLVTLAFSVNVPGPIARVEKRQLNSKPFTMSSDRFTKLLTTVSALFIVTRDECGRSLPTH